MPKGVVSAPIPGSLATARVVYNTQVVTPVQYFVIFADYSDTTLWKTLLYHYASVARLV